MEVAGPHPTNGQDQASTHCSQMGTTREEDKGQTTRYLATNSGRRDDSRGSFSMHRQKPVNPKPLDQHGNHSKRAEIERKETDQNSSREGVACPIKSNGSTDRATPVQVPGSSLCTDMPFFPTHCAVALTLKQNTGPTGKGNEPQVTLRECSLDDAMGRFDFAYDMFFQNYAINLLPTPPFIRRIFWIDNPFLHARYQKKRKEMEKCNNGKMVREEYLFHGTPMKNVDSICSGGFRLPQKAHWFGWSICFSSFSPISDAYTNCTLDYGEQPFQPFPQLAGPSSRPSLITQQEVFTGSLNHHQRQYKAMPVHNLGEPVHCRHYMFLCNVLVGDSVASDHFCGYATPPPRPDKPGRLFDSCQGQGKNSGHVAIFEESQANPMYLIEYDHMRQAPICEYTRQGFR